MLSINNLYGVFFMTADASSVSSSVTSQIRQEQYLPAPSPLTFVKAVSNQFPLKEIEQIAKREKHLDPHMAISPYSGGQYQMPVLSYFIDGYGDKAYDLVEILLEKKFNVNNTDSFGETVLEMAAKRGAIKVFGLLLDNPTTKLSSGLIKQIGEQMEKALYHLAFMPTPGSVDWAKIRRDNIEKIREYINGCIPRFNKTREPKDKLPTIEKFDVLTLDSIPGLKEARDAYNKKQFDWSMR